MAPRSRRAHEVKPLQVRLPATLIKRIKHYSVESNKSLSAIAEEAFLTYLDHPSRKAKSP